ncbi:hypothetical protein ACFLV3_02535 [Chloroflexota bacterium]
MPNYELFIRELTAWQASLTAKSIEEYISLGFLPFVIALDAAISNKS